MAPALLEPQQLDEKYHFLLRRLHSLSGIIPIGAFLIEHMLTNSVAARGPERFNESVHFLHELPYLRVLEVFGIFLPIAFHAVYGIRIAWGGRSNVSAYPHMDNRRYFLQRLTGYLAFVFLVIHLLKFRFAHWVGWGPEFIGSQDPFEITRDGLMMWEPIEGFVVPAWITFTIYGVGLSAACFHFANGIWGFCISWGITVGAKAQRRVGLAAAVVGLVLFIWGCLGLYAFASAPGPARTASDRVLASQGPQSVFQKHETDQNFSEGALKAAVRSEPRSSRAATVRPPCLPAGRERSSSKLEGPHGDRRPLPHGRGSDQALDTRSEGTRIRRSKDLRFPELTDSRRADACGPGVAADTLA